MQIQAGRYVIEIRELTWWDNEEINSAMASGAKVDGTGKLSGINGSVLLDIKVKRFEKSIVSIKEGEKVVPFSVEWMKQLTQEEGEEISKTIEEPKKK